MRKEPVAGGGAVDGDALRQYFSNGEAAYGSNQGAICIDNNNFDEERVAKIAWFKDTVNNGDQKDTTYMEFSVTFPVRIPPFKGNRKGLWYDQMSDCLPYVKNSSVNLQIKQGLNGIALEEFFIDKANRTVAGANTAAADRTQSASPDFTTNFNYSNAELEVTVSPDKNWNFHVRWFQSPVPLSDSYNIKTFRLDHYLKAVKPALTANPQRKLDSTVTSDLIRVGSKPEYLLMYVGEDILGAGRGNDANFGVTGTENAFSTGYMSAANIEIQGIDLQISNQQGVLNSSMNADALRYYTLENVCSDFAHRPDAFRKFRNFIFIRTADIAAPNGPAGILQNCNIKVTAKLGYYGYNTSENGVGLVQPDYNLNVCLVYTHSKIQVSDRGVVLMDQDSSPGEYDQLVVADMASLGPGLRHSGVKSSYKSHF